MRPVTELVDLFAHDQAAPVQLAEVTVVPLAAAGMLGDPIEHAEPPTGATYVARARGRELFVDADEMAALVEAGARFDLGTSA